MQEPRFDDLSHDQCDYLRLVLRHFQSKEIAIERGRSKKSVDRALDAARLKLGAATRFQAARMLAEHETRQGVYDPGDTIPMAFEAAPDKLAGPTQQAFAPTPNVAAHQLGEARGPFVYDLPAMATAGGANAEELKDDLKRSPLSTIRAVLLIVLLLLAATSFVVVLMRMANDVGRALMPYITG